MNKGFIKVVSLMLMVALLAVGAMIPAWAAARGVIITDETQLEDGATYRIRNASNGKYLEVGGINVYQNDFDPNSEKQIVTYHKLYDGTSSWGFAGSLYGRNITISPMGDIDSWIVEFNPDGTATFFNTEPLSIMLGGYMAAIGDENGIDDEHSLFQDGDICIDYPGLYPLYWYIEKA